MRTINFNAISHFRDLAAKSAFKKLKTYKKFKKFKKL